MWDRFNFPLQRNIDHRGRQANTIEGARRLFSSPALTFNELYVADLRTIAEVNFDKAVSANLVEHISQDVYPPACAYVWRHVLHTPTPRIFERLKAHDCILKKYPPHIELMLFEDYTWLNQ